MKEFYQNLQAKRQEKGLSLEDLHERTRLPLNYLGAIELGEIHRIPEGYQRIYLRRYAKEIGLDPEEVARDFDLLTGRLTPAENISSTPSKTRKPQGSKAAAPQRAPEPESRRVIEKVNLDKVNRLFWISLTGIILLAAGFFTYKTYLAEEGDQNVVIKEIPISQLMSSPPAADSAVTPSTAKIEEKPSEPFSVVLKATHQTWVREIRDAADTSDYILSPGNRRTINASESVQLRLGRADGLEIVADGKPLGQIGAANEVANLTLTREGITGKNLTKVSKPAGAAAPRDSSPAPPPPGIPPN